MSMSTKRPSLWRVLSETSSIISSRFRHFLALSVLLLFPISLATIIYPHLLHTTSVHSHYRRLLSYVSTPDSEVPPVGKSQLLLQFLYDLFVAILNFCAVSSITYSTFHGFHGRPVRFTSSFKSILISFLPLLATTLVKIILQLLILSAVALCMTLSYSGLVLLGFPLDYQSIYFNTYVILIVAVLVVLLIYLQLEWHLSTVIVVVESEWGFAPLKRSSYLVKGMRRVVFLMASFFGIVSGVLSMGYSNFVAKELTGWVVLQMVVYAGLCTILSLYSLVADTVLFSYSKALHGESDQIDEKLGMVYVQLPSDVVNAV